LKQSFENGLAVIGTIQQYEAEQKGERNNNGERRKGETHSCSLH
jgi:hypothetical protein